MTKFVPSAFLGALVASIASLSLAPIAMLA
jgi:hypothetical protein